MDVQVNMENHNLTERSPPVQFVRGSRAFKQFKNPPQPHMCIQDTIKDTSQKLFINVLGWQKIANPKQYTDPIPLYGGMQIPQGCGPNSNKPQLLVFAVMVNPDILKANGKNAANTVDRNALVRLLCEFVEAMNPGLLLARNPIIMKDKDLAGELKDVWLAVQNKREREKGLNQDVMYKVYDIDGIGSEDLNDDDKLNSSGTKEYDSPSPPHDSMDKKHTVKSSKQILMNAGQRSEFDSGMNNYQLNQNTPVRDNRSGNPINSQNAETTYCTPVYGQIVSSRENHNHVNEIQQKYASFENNAPSTSFGKECNYREGKSNTVGWEECSQPNMASPKNGPGRDLRQWYKSGKNKKSDTINNGKGQYDFFPVFDNKTVTDNSDLISSDSKTNKLKGNDEDTKLIIEPMQKLVLHKTDNEICDSKSSALSSISS